MYWAAFKKQSGACLAGGASAFYLAMVTRLLSASILVCTLSLPLACKGDKSKPAPSADDARAAVPVAAQDAQASADQPADGGPDDAGVAATATSDAGASKPTDDKGKLANIQVLPKSWDKARVVRFMKTDVSKGLGVECSFCHAKDDFVSDDNEHKTVARKMITLTFDANKKYFGGKSKVTCATCHNGQKEPPK